MIEIRNSFLLEFIALLHGRLGMGDLIWEISLKITSKYLSSTDVQNRFAILLYVFEPKHNEINCSLDCVSEEETLGETIFEKRKRNFQLVRINFSRGITPLIKYLFKIHRYEPLWGTVNSANEFENSLIHWLKPWTSEYRSFRNDPKKCTLFHIR